MFVAESITPEVTTYSGFALPSPFDGVFKLMSRYRRIMDYLRLLSDHPEYLDGKGIYSGPVDKCLRAIESFERTAVEISAALHGADARAPQLMVKLQQILSATRILLDQEIRKHCAHTGVVLLKRAESGLSVDCDSIALGGLHGNRSAIFGVVESGMGEEGSLGICLMDSGSRTLFEDTIKVVPDGLTPFVADFIMGGLPDGTSLVLSMDGNSISVPIACRPVLPAVLKGRIVDKETQKTVACRVHLTDTYGKFRAPIGSRTTTAPTPWGGPEWNTRARHAGQAFFYCDGSFELPVAPGKVSLRCVRGFEYQVCEETIEVRSGEVREINLELTRHINMPVWGWHSGQTHIHSQNLMPVNDSSGWHVFPDAEGLEVSFLSTFHQSEEIFTDEYPIGAISRFSRPDYCLLVGEEFRHAPFGHMTFLNLKALVPPISSGRLGGRNWLDTPCNAQAIDAAHEQGAVACYCHLDACGPIVVNDELPIDAALGKVDCGEVMGAGGGFRYWYPMLNCGIRMGVCAGPDWDLEDCCRVYVYTGNVDLSFQEWMDGLKAQRSFVTTGPMLFLTVNDEKPGSVIAGPSADKLRIRAHATSTDPVRKLEVVVNGEVALCIEGVAEEHDLGLEMDLSPQRNCWIAARCWGEGNAHTSPIYIELNQESMGTAADARELLSISEKCIRWTEQNGLFASREERDEVLGLFRKGADYYRRIMNAGQ